MQQKFEALQAGFRANANPDLATRDVHLGKLAKMIADNTDAIIEAITEDFGHRSPIETQFGETLNALTDIKHTRKQLAKWMRVEKRSVSIHFVPAKAEVRYQPKGVVGVISPWNYPFSMAINPTIAALAAGNRVMIKPSELTPKTSALLAKLIAQYFEPDHITVITGGPDVAQKFSALPFDHILFTGSSKVGSFVMQAAAKNLTPVTLELGGKSPTILDGQYPMQLAVDKIVSGKLFNSGQTCIAPDYVLVPKAREADFVQTYTDTVKRFYPTILDNPDFTAIISEGHFERLSGLLEDARKKGANVTEIYPDEVKQPANTRKMPPKIVTGTTDDMKITQEEIFGPILPVITYDTVDEALDYVMDRPHPLAFYGFSKDRGFVNKLLDKPLAGGVSINDTLLHIVQNDLPFGGVGNSGMGSYHGFDGFKTFSHAKGVFHQSGINARNMMFPPYGKTMDKLLKMLG
ncbi:Aldehyde dehydrogenase [hydrothermal vent metagenome]|uniref:Aldehyde dehydrogenase n=1 Tax=hydrothermal vent metagenome TaxID=652676 RepID=A0A3B0RDT7_9ZZZZ